ncbi:MAG: hypothetical protein JJU45_13695, partial [Acidimicrobiia bacterium]|nr:hypothetical protein [Acidimicrobiia bacterium]
MNSDGLHPVPSGGEYSVEFWFRADATQTSTGNEYLFRRMKGDSLVHRFGVYLADAGSELRLRVRRYRHSSCTSLSTNQELVIDGDFRDGSWYHVVATAGLGDVRLVINGSLAGIEPNPEGCDIKWSSEGDRLVVGSVFGNSQQFRGWIDEVAEYHSVVTVAEARDRWVASGRDPVPEWQLDGSWVPPEASATCNWVSRWVGLCDNSEGNPVSTRSGALHESFVDVAVDGPGAGLVVQRGYSSLRADADGPFGPGWSTNVTTHLLFDEPSDGAVTLVMGSGAETNWFDDGAGGFVAAPWVESSLSVSGSGSSAVYTIEGHDGRVLEFDADGRLVELADRNGYVNEYSYDSSDRLETVREAATGRELTFEWDGDLIEKVIDPANREVVYGYDDGRLTSVTDVGGGVWAFDYDSEGRLTHKIDPVQSASSTPAATVSEYDSEGRVFRQTAPDGGVWDFDYDSVPDSTVVTMPGAGSHASGPHDAVRLDEYDWTGRRVRSVEGYGSADAMVWRYDYDHQTGGITAVVLESVSPERLVAETSYDPATGLVEWTRDALGRQTSFGSYTAFGQPGQITHPDGAVTTTVYDGAGNVLSSTTEGVDEKTTSVSFVYDPAHPGRVESMTDPRSEVWSYDYDDNGYRDEVIDPLGNKTTWEFDAVGRIEWSTAPKGHLSGGEGLYTTSFETNAFGEVTEVTNPLGESTSVTYDELGRPEVFTDAEGRVTTNHYDAAGRLWRVERNDASAIETEFWPDGSTKAQVNAASERTEFDYDELGRLRVQRDPLGRATVFNYRPDGALWWRQDPGGDCVALVRCAVYTSDDAGQVTSISYNDPDTADVTSILYDQAGRRTHVVTTDDTLVFGYDGLGRLTSSTEAGKTVTYGHDPAGNVETVTYPDNAVFSGSNTITRTYDKAGRWVKLTDFDGREFHFTPDEHSNLKTITFPGAAGQVDSYAYDRADRMDGVTFADGAGVWASIGYERFDDGQLKETTQAGLAGPASEAYTYDALGRLKSAGGLSFGYDDAGNLRDRGAFVQQRFDQANQLCMRMWPAGAGAPECDDPPTAATMFDHDDSGRRVAVDPPDGAGPPSDFAYDAEGRMTEATVPTFAGNDGEFTAVSPTRIIDTRTGSGMCPASGCGELEPDDTIVFDVAGLAGVPAAGQVAAVSLTVTTEGIDDNGWVVVYAEDVTVTPDAISAHFMDGEEHSVGVLSRVSTGGQVKLTNHGHGSVEVTVDVTGWFSSAWGPSGGTLTAADPQRLTGSTPLAVASAST